jgi:hypothetical protein
VSVRAINALLNTYKVPPYQRTEIWHEEQEVVEWATTRVVEATCCNSVEWDKRPDECDTASNATKNACCEYEYPEVATCRTTLEVYKVGGYTLEPKRQPKLKILHIK